MKIKKIIAGFTMLLLLVGCSENEDYELFNKTSLQDECILDCEIDDGGPGGTTLPEFSNYFYTHRGETNKNVYYATSNNGSNWTTHQLGLGAKSSQGPTSVLFDNKRFIFFKGDNSPNIFLAYKTQLSNDWYGNTYINNTSETLDPVNATVFDDKIFIGYKGRSDKKLHLAYSSTGTTGNFSKVLVGPTSTSKVDDFAIAVRGNKMYVFWAFRYQIPYGGLYKESLVYISSTNPTDPNSWSQAQLLDDSFIVNNSYKLGLGATTLNGDIYVTFAKGFDSSASPSSRLLNVGKLSQNETWSVNSTGINFEHRAGVMGTSDAKLLVTYTRLGGGSIKTMKVNPNGTIITQPYNSGGGTDVGGISSYSKFN